MTIGEQQEWLRRYLDRHRVTRRTALKGGASVLAALGATTAPWALAALRARREHAGRRDRAAPVVRRRPDAGRWRSRPSSPASRTAGSSWTFGTDAGYGQTVEAEVRELVSMVPQQDGSIRAADQFFVHALADGLAPGATFHYRFRLADGTTTAGRGVHHRARADRARAVHVHRVRRPGREHRPDADGQTGFSDNYYKPDDTRRTAAPSDALVALVAAQRPRSTCSRATSATPTPAATGTR